MSRKKRYEEVIQGDLDLAPIMNMVMILIPLLLLSAVFTETGVIDITSPQNAQSPNTPTEEQELETPIPKVVVAISSDGFRLANMNAQLPPESFAPYSAPIAGCPGAGQAAAVDPYNSASAPATICLRSDVPADAPLLRRLNWAALYNRLVEVRLKPEWFEKFGEENNGVLNILADPEIEFEVVTRTMDVGRYLLAPGGAAVEPPAAGAALQTYLLNGGEAPTEANFEDSPFIRNPEGGYSNLFPDPVLLLTRPQGN
jgi:hypothetical protein